MRSGVRILFYGAASQNADWLRSSLSANLDEGWLIEFERVAEEESAPEHEADTFDVLVLDDSIGIQAASDLLSSHLLHSPSKPYLIGVHDDFDRDWDHLIRQGAQDFLLKDGSSNAEFKRVILNAIDRARILEATQEAEIQLRTIIENIDDGVLILDSGGAVLFANPAVEDLLGLSLENIYGLKAPLDIPDKAVDFITIEPEGKSRSTLHVHVYPVRWEGRECNLITMRDVTTEQQIGEQLRRARSIAEETASMKTTFLANMSHELRMPLASIIGFAQLIEEGSENDDFVEFATLIQESSHRLLSTINSVLEATRLDKHYVEPQLQPVRIDQVVRSTVKQLQPLVLGSEVELSCSGPDHSLALADLGFVERVLTNLIGNATKFTAKGSILINWVYEGDYVRIDVRDTGLGIDAKFLPHVFDEFTQESSGPGRSYEGSGLGLTIVRGLVELMSGRIEIESEKGVGTHFSVYIPRADR